MRGGAMYVLKKGLGLPWLGAVFALLTSVAAFGIGNMVQTSSVADALRATFGIATNVTVIGLVILTAIVILGGIKSIARVTEWLVPFMAILYLLGTKAALPYRLLWLVFVYVGATGSLHLVWDIADTLNGLMAIPNPIGVLVSIPLLLRLQREFFGRPRG
jgi:Na+/alanine symporter